MIPKSPPPVAPRHPTVLEVHGDRRVDEYHWLRDPTDPETLAYLESENRYCAEAMEPTIPLQNLIYDEIVSRIAETDETAPAANHRYWYLQRTFAGKAYPVHCRRHAGPEGAETVILDENLLAEGQTYFALGNIAISPDERLLAYSTDTTGGERMDLRIRNLDSGTEVGEVILDTYYGLAWAADSASIFYIRPDQAMRPWQVWRHRLGADPAEDVLVFQEDDERFFLDVEASRSQSYVFINSRSSMTTEVRFIDCHQPAGALQLIEPRRQGIEYSADHSGDRFLIVTNDDARNFRLVQTPVDRPGREQWQEMLPERDGVTITGVTAFARHGVVWERAEGLLRMRVLDLGDGSSEVVPQPESVFSISPGLNFIFDTDLYRFEYSSLTTPSSTIDHDIATGQRHVRRVAPVRGGYDPAAYVTERLWATAGDGVRIPISTVRRRDVALDGRAPALLYGYGAYEISIEPRFSSLRLSLLDRGFVFAIAHVRGGGELGRPWYEQGRLLNKRNTFTDFIACAEYLKARGYAAPDRLGIRGGSAGGLLMGAVVNMRPDLFAAVLADVPFVDVLTTILDESLPLTIHEWEEWGDPRQDEYYRYIKSYSPYDNMTPRPYPTMLVTAGLNDPRVGYWEPAKWVARQRAERRGGRPLLLKVEMGAGHFGPSGRYAEWREEATKLAFIITAVGLGERG